MLDISCPALINRRPRGFTRSLVFHENTGDHGEIPHRHRVANERVAKLAHFILEKHYPGHMWAVAANVFQGIVVVKLQSFSDWSEIINLYTHTPPSDDFEHAVKDAGGNWLTRFGFPRKGMDVDDYIKAMRTYLPTFTRRLKPDN